MSEPKATRRGGVARRVAPFLRDMLSEFNHDRVLLHAAALSYYTIFSLPPLLVVCLGIGSMVFGADAARGEIVAQLHGYIGERGAEILENALQAASEPQAHGWLATSIAAVVLVLGSTGCFVQLQTALNTIWGVKPAPVGSRIWDLVRKRLVSFAMVLGVGLLLLASLVISAGLAASREFLRYWLPSAALVEWLPGVDFALSFAIVTLLFAGIFAILPDAKVRWRDAWVGAAATALLFTVGKALIGWYLGRGTAGSAYGAAGSLAIVLVWIYVSSIILFVGAEFTQVVARRRGATAPPEPHAVRVEEITRTVST